MKDWKQEASEFLVDRMNAGKHEEVGSLDSATFGDITLFILKDDEDVYYVNSDKSLVGFNITPMTSVGEICVNLEDYIF